MTQAQHGGERWDADHEPDDPRPTQGTRRRARDRVILTQPPPASPMPARPDRDDGDPPAPEPKGTSADDDLLATIDELIADR